MSSTVIPLSIVSLRVHEENSRAANQTPINLYPDFQRKYESWNLKLKNKLIETILAGRAMNPIWTVHNAVDDSDEVLDGMHRLTTCIDFLNNKWAIHGNYLSDSELKNTCDKKKFCDLEKSQQNLIRNYNFTFNNLDRSYREDRNKLREMYEILNRSSMTLNEFEFNKVLYAPFYKLVEKYKNDFSSFILDKKDTRGKIESEIITLLSLCQDNLPTSWSSLNDLRNKFMKEKLGTSEEEVTAYLQAEGGKVRETLSHMVKIMETLTQKGLINKEDEHFKHNSHPLRIFVSRLTLKLHDTTLFNRHIKNLLPIFKTDIIDVPHLEQSLGCNSRNATFQKKLLQEIDQIIDAEYDPDDPKNRRKFPTKMKEKQRKLQNNLCNKCECKLDDVKYEADHIIPYRHGGTTTMDNLQVLCTVCHKEKTAE